MLVNVSHRSAVPKGRYTYWSEEEVSIIKNAIRIVFGDAHA